MSSTSKNNILEEITRVNDWMYMTKMWRPVVANRNGLKLTVAEMIPMIVRSPRINEAIRQTHLYEGIPVVDLQRRVVSVLQEMGHYKRFSLIRWLGVALCYILKRNYTGIIVNEPSVTRVKSVMGSNPVIFAPSHKSYADFILMSFLCYHYEIEIPVIAAGQDFQSMWVMGKVLRECGAFFIRRTFGDDHLYKAIMAEYIDVLMEMGEAPLEFFVEGTRSRSGKSLPPKFGLMSMALEPYFLGKVPDITIVPVSISYERVLEESLFARELLGVPKPRESTLLLVKALQLMRENYGRIFVEFGNPISLKEFSVTDVDPRVILNQEPIGLNEQFYPGPQVQECIKNLCYHIIGEQNKLLTITPYNMLAASLSIWTVYKSAVPLNTVEMDVKCFQDILSVLGCSTIVTGPVRDEILYSLSLHEKVVYFDSADETLKLNLGFASTSKSEPAKTEPVGDQPTKLANLRYETLLAAYPIVFVQQYANPLCLQCIHVSLITFVLRTTPHWKRPEGLNTEESILVEYSFFRTLFSSEFALEDDMLGCTRDFHTAMEQLKILKLFFSSSEAFKLEMNNDDLRNAPLEGLLMGLLLPFVQGYKLCLDIMYLMSQEEKAIPVAEMKFHMQRALEQELERNDVSKYILSLDLISNAIKGLLTLGAIYTETRESGTCICFLGDKISSLRDELGWRWGCIKLALHQRLNMTESLYWSKYRRCRL